MDIISVIIPIYNVEKYLNRCIESVLNQTYEKLEIILVDDGSNDKSPKICDHYGNIDNRVKVLHKHNEGLGYARNSGLDCATGKYVTFIDGDDYIGEDHIKSMYECLLDSKSDTCLGGHTRKYNKKETVHPNVCAGKVYSENITKEILPRMCGYNSRGGDYIEMSVCMVLFSNEIIQNNMLRFVSERNFVSEDLMFDFDYYSHARKICCGTMTDYYYCDNEGSLTTKYRSDRFKQQIALYKAVYSKAEKMGILENCKLRLDDTLISIARYSIKLEYKFQYVNGKSQAKKNVKAICCDENLIKIFAGYDDSNTKISSRLVNALIKHKRFLLLRVTMWIKNTFKI